MTYFHKNIERVSVIIPSYNHSAYVEDCINSIANQQGLGVFFSLEIILVDDASSDQTAAIAQQILLTHEGKIDYRVIVKETNSGLKHSIEMGLKVATGKFVQILASDDMLIDNKLKTQILFLEAHPKVDIVYSKTFQFDTESGERTNYPYKEFEELANSGASTELFDAAASLRIPVPLLQSALSRSEPFSDAFTATRTFRSDDWAVMLHFASKYDVGFAENAGFLYRRHPENTSSQRDLALANQMEVILLLVPPTLRRRALAKVLQIHALHFASISERKLAVRYLVLSITATGIVGFWFRFAFRVFVKRIRTLGRTSG